MQTYLFGIGILDKLRYHVSMNTLKQLYHTLVYLYRNYGSTSWGTACQTKFKKIKISHITAFIASSLHTKEIMQHFTLFEILKLENIFKLKIGSLVHKLQYNKKTPPALHDLVSLPSDIHKYNTRFPTSQNLYRTFSSN